MSKTIALLVAAVLILMTLMFKAWSQPSTRPWPPVRSDTTHSTPPVTRPYSCQLRDAAERACAYNPACDKRELDRLTKECLRDGGRP